MFLCRQRVFLPTAIAVAARKPRVALGLKSAASLPRSHAPAPSSQGITVARLQHPAEGSDACAWPSTTPPSQEGAAFAAGLPLLSLATTNSHGKSRGMPNQHARAAPQAASRFPAAPPPPNTKRREQTDAEESPERFAPAHPVCFPLPSLRDPRSPPGKTPFTYAAVLPAALSSQQQPSVRPHSSGPAPPGVLRALRRTTRVR